MLVLAGSMGGPRCGGEAEGGEGRRIYSSGFFGPYKEGFRWGQVLDSQTETRHVVRCMRQTCTQSHLKSVPVKTCRVHVLVEVASSAAAQGGNFLGLIPP